MADPNPQPTETTLSIPSLLFVAVLSFFAYRYFTSPSSASSRATDSRNNPPINPASVEQISQMFPDLDRRSIVWDLRRNGGNVAATVERVVNGRGLDRPPPSFQPNLEPPPDSNANQSNADPRNQPPAMALPDLITRYNLQAQVARDEKGKAVVRDDEQEEKGGGGGGWGKSKAERAEMLQKRREEMILRARRKIVDKDREAGGG
ncbi:MAG: hypothetical protein Q9227_004792 [Pyrenula ochraceoflavens]